MRQSELQQLADKLKKAVLPNVHAVIGFDGFVDEVVHVVKKRIDPENYTRVLTLTEYGQRIAATSGLSSNVEIVTVSKKLGGNGPIFANALLEYGLQLSYIGAVGYPDINPVFRDMASRCCAVFPVCDPASTDAVEFDDGKIIRCKLTPFKELTFENILDRIGIETLAGILDAAGLIGFVNWALPPYSGDIWRSIYGKILPLVKTETSQKKLFFDLADPESRQESELGDALETIGLFAGRFDVILGLNLREAVQIANLFGGAFGYSETDMEALARYIARHVSIGTLVIHPLKEACCLKHGEFSIRKGPYCVKPRLTTGAGDNFNAGFVLGELMGLEATESLILGMASSGFYVRHARSARYEEIIGFLTLWSKGLDN